MLVFVVQFLFVNFDFFVSDLSELQKVKKIANKRVVGFICIYTTIVLLQNIRRTA
jgi:hypothetical protein